jgi:hypothetical protein
MTPLSEFVHAEGGSSGNFLIVRKTIDSFQGFKDIQVA